MTFRLPGRVRERLTVDEIRESGLFDEWYYVQQYPDVAQSSLDAITHYVRIGAEEGRNPLALFETRFYLEKNPDVAKSGLNPLLHYVRFGGRQGRDPHPAFDTQAYLRQHPFVAEAGINPLLHHVKVGARRSARRATRPARSAGQQASTADPSAADPAGDDKPQPSTAGASVRVRGNVDRVSATGVFGWARDAERPDDPVLLDVIVDGALEDSVFADRYREDLAQKLGGSGRHGFAWEVPPTRFEDRDGEIEIRPRQGSNAIVGGRAHIERFVSGIPLERTKTRREAPRLSVERPGDPPSPTAPASVEVIVLNRDGAHLLERFFREFTRFNAYRSCRVTVVDHGSTDDSESVGKRWAQELDLRWIDRGGNYSFSESNNFAARDSDADVLVFANNDLYWCEDVLPGVTELLRDPETAIVGIKLFDAPHSQDDVPRVQHLGVHFDRFRRTTDAQSAQWITPFETRGTDDPGRLDKAPVRTPAVTGAFLAMRREDFTALGGFDEGYFYGYEDVDLCLQAQLTLGGAVVCANDQAAFHERGSSRKHFDPRSARRLLANRQHLDARFGYAYRRRSRADQFERPGFWGVSPPRVAFAVTEAGDDAKAGDYFTALELARQLQEHHPCECVFLERGDSWYDLSGVDVLIAMLDQYDPERIRNASPHLLRVAWMRNWFERFAAHPSAACFDAVWASSQRAADFLECELGKPVAVLPLATAFDDFQRGEHHEELSSDYCFTGHYWGAERGIMANLDPASLPYEGRVFGAGWDQVAGMRDLAAGPLPYARMRDVYASTRVVVDDANHVTKPWGSVNSRVFDAIAAGALVVTNSSGGSESLFDGQLPTYDSRDDLTALLREYLDDEESRLRLLAKLRDQVASQHTYRHRAESVWQLLREATRDQLRIAIKIGAPNPSVRDEWGDFHFAQSLKRALDRAGATTRIDCMDAWSSPPSLGDDVVIVLRGLSEYHPRADQINLLWIISHPDKTSVEECAGYDHVFVASQRFASFLRPRLDVPVSVLLQATDPERFCPPATDDPASRSRNEKGQGVVFVGNSRNVFRPIVRDCVAAGIDLRVFGTRWEQFLGSELIAGEHVPNTQLGAVYSSSLVVLNDHWDSMREWGFLSNRLFDAVAAGAQVLSDRVEGLEEVFGDVVATYEGPDQLRDFTERAEQREEATRSERRRLANEVRELHCFERRAEVLLAVARELDAERLVQPPARPPGATPSSLSGEGAPS